MVGGRWVGWFSGVWSVWHLFEESEHNGCSGPVPGCWICMEIFIVTGFVSSCRSVLKGEHDCQGRGGMRAWKGPALAWLSGVRTSEGP